MTDGKRYNLHITRELHEMLVRIKDEQGMSMQHVLSVGGRKYAEWLLRDKDGE